MILNRAGREFVYMPYTADENVTGLNVQVYANGSWYDAADITATDVVILAAGPDAADNPPGTVVLRPGANRLMVRFPDNPEIIVRDGGVVHVTDY